MILFATVEVVPFGGLGFDLFPAIVAVDTYGSKHHNIVVEVGELGRGEPIAHQMLYSLTTSASFFISSVISRIASVLMCSVTASASTVSLPSTKTISSLRRGKSS